MPEAAGAQHRHLPHDVTRWPMRRSDPSRKRPILDRWRNTISAAHGRCRCRHGRRGPRRPRQRAQCHRCQDGAQRDVARRPDREHEDDGRRANRKRREHREYACGGGHALAATKAQPHGIDVPHDRGQAGQRRARLARRQPSDPQHTRCALRHVEQQHAHGDRHSAGPQDIGRADVAAAGAADVDASGQSAHEQRKRNRSDEVAERQRDNRHGRYQMRSYGT